MKNNYTVLLFVGAISAIQLNTFKKHHQRSTKAWDAKTEANLTIYANETRYEADTPAGYGGTANTSESETNATVDATADATVDANATSSALASKKGPQNLQFLQTAHQGKKHHTRSN